MRRSWVMLLLLWMVAWMAVSAAPLDALIAEYTRDPALAGARVGVVVQSLDSGNMLAAQRANEVFIPASTTKVLTAALALEYMKPEYRFGTQVMATGNIVQGVLQGDIYLRGGGDPSLVSEDLDALAQALATGDQDRQIPPITSVTGRLLVDDTFFPGPGPLLGPGWQADDLPWYYAAPASAVSCHRNAVTVRVRGTTANAPAVVMLSPATRFFTIEHRVMTRSSVKTGAVTVCRTGRRITISGRVAPGVELVERVSVPDPALFTGELFRDALTRQGITVGEVARGACPSRYTVLVEHLSLPLRDLVRPVLKDSDNHTAEQLRWSLLALYSLERPLVERYPAMIRDFCTHSGMLAHGIQLVDGSGLSRQNAITPLGLLRMLTYARMSDAWPEFRDALSVAGVDGTLRTRMVGTAAEGNARAKTGGMSGVSALAGYVTTDAGESLAYVIVVNNYRHGAPAARRLQDRLVAALAALE